jgi:hypothetical protein
MRWLAPMWLLAVCACSPIIEAGDEVGAEIPAMVEVFPPESDVHVLAWEWPWNRTCNVQDNIACGLGGGTCDVGKCNYTRNSDCTRTYYCVDDDGEKTGEEPSSGWWPWTRPRPRDGINPRH